MSEPVQMRLAPWEGGAIVSLIAHDEEWLVQGPPRTAPGNDTVGFTDQPPRGWDEMMPTIDSCHFGGRTIPDHGEAWRHAWVPHGDGLRFVSAHGYTLDRTILHDERGVRMDYTLSSDRPMPFLWAPHPLLRAPAGSRVEIDPIVAEAYDISSPGSAVRIPLTAQDLAIDSVGPGRYRKFVFPPSSVIARARVVRADGSWVGLEWDLASVPYLAVYLERKAFTSEDCIAIEPMTGWYDDLSRAVAQEMCAWVSPGAPRRWHLQVTAGRTEEQGT